MPLRFAAPGVEGLVARENRGARVALAELEQAFCRATGLGMQDPLFMKAFVGDSSSVVAMPVYEHGGMLKDVMTGEALPRETVEATWDRIGASEAGAAPKAVGFIPALCPVCGWNLSGEGDSEVVLCENCNSAWTSRGRDFVNVPLGVVGGGQGQGRKSGPFLPFWCIKAQVQGIALSTYGDLARFANVPKVVRADEAGEGVHFWIPAFKVRGELLLRLSRLMTLAQPKGPVERELPKAYLYPVTLSKSEAKDLLPVLIAALAMAKKKVFPLLEGMAITVGEATLTLLPFRRQGDELVSALFPFSVSANALKYGRNL